MAEVGRILAEAARRLGDRTDAEALLLHLLGRPRSWLIAHAQDVLEDEPLAAFEALLERRARGEPVAYLIGSRGFWTLDLEVTPATLIPRPETELLVEQALARLPAGKAVRIADLGTGSGAIALALARECPQAQVHATDASGAALAVAQRNARRNGVSAVHFHQGDWLVPLHGLVFDLVVSNPPYIEVDDPHLQQGDLRFEPPGALASGADGLDAIRTIVADARGHLQRGGWLLLEHGWTQGPAVRQLLEAAGYEAVSTALDLEGRERVSAGRWDG